MITLTRGSTTFVASSRPPMPTSSTAKSTCSRAKYPNPIVVIISKKLGCHGSSLFSTSVSAIRSILPCSSEKSLSLTSLPFNRMRSLIRIKCGEVYKPVFKPDAFRMDANVAAVEPFPFVPAINTLGKRRSG